MNKDERAGAPEAPETAPENKGPAEPALQTRTGATIPTGPEAEEENGRRGEAQESSEVIPRELSILPLRDNVLFPAVVAPLTVNREASIKLIDDAAVAESRIIGIVTL